MKNKNIEVTVVILNHSKASQAVESVKCLLNQKTTFEFEILVIDNSSDKNQVKIMKEGVRGFSQINLIINAKNIGYTRGHNKIKGKEKGRYLAIVNPDVLFNKEDSLQKMVEYLDEHLDIAILGPKQINDNGKVAMSVRAFPRFFVQTARRTFLRNWPLIKKMVDYDEMRHLDYNEIQDVDWLQSSCVLIRRDFWEKIGGYNEDYFLFMADAEICLKAWEMGYRVVYYPRVRVYADGKRLSEGGVKEFFQSWIMRQHVIDSLRYCWKHLWSPNPRRNYYKERGIKNNY